MIAAGEHAYFEEYLAETVRLLANNDQRGFYIKHLKSTVGLEERKARGEQLIRDEDGTLMTRCKLVNNGWGSAMFVESKPGCPDHHVI